MACPPRALGSAVADASGVDGRHSELVFGVGVRRGGTIAGQVLVTRTNLRLGRPYEHEDLLDDEPHGKTDQEDDSEQRVHPRSLSSDRPGHSGRETEHATCQSCGPVMPRTWTSAPRLAAGLPGERGGPTRRVS